MALSLDRSGWTALKIPWSCRRLRPTQQERDFGGRRSTLQLQRQRVSPFIPALTCAQPVKPVTVHLLSCPLVSVSRDWLHRCLLGGHLHQPDVLLLCDEEVTVHTHRGDTLMSHVMLNKHVLFYS